MAQLVACFHCQKSKPKSAYYSNRARKNGLCTYCIECLQKWRRENSKKKRALLKESMQAGNSKTCVWCKVTSPVTDFTIDTSTRDGLSRMCGDCRRSYYVKIRRVAGMKEKKQTDLALNGTKSCKRCRKSKPITRFSQNPKRQDGLRAYCKGCDREIQQRRYSIHGSADMQKHIAKVKADPFSIRYWRMRVKHKTYGDIEPEILKERYYADPSCQYCGIVFGSPEEMQLDHRCPKHRGGKNIVENITFACPQCNRMKHDMTAAEFLEFLREYHRRLNRKFSLRVVRHEEKGSG